MGRGTVRPAARPGRRTGPRERGRHRLPGHSGVPGRQERHAHYPDRDGGRRGSRRSRPRGKPVASGRQRHGNVRRIRGRGREIAPAARRDRSAGLQGCGPLEPGEPGVPDPDAEGNGSGRPRPAAGPSDGGSANRRRSRRRDPNGQTPCGRADRARGPGVHGQPRPPRRAGGQGPPPSNLRDQRGVGGRGPHVLRPGLLRPEPAERGLRGSDPQGRQARRPADRAANEVRAGRQPQDGEGLGLAIPPSVLGRADKIIDPRSGRRRAGARSSEGLDQLTSCQRPDPARAGAPPS
jgi:hypothetical protein